MRLLLLPMHGLCPMQASLIISFRVPIRDGEEADVEDCIPKSELIRI